MKKKLEPIYTICMPLMLSAVLVLGWCYKLKSAGATAYFSLLLSLAVCAASLAYSKRASFLAIYRSLAFCFVFLNQIPYAWIESCLGGTLPKIDILSSLVSEVFILFRIAMVLAVLYLAAGKLQISGNPHNRQCMIFAVILFAAGIAFPDFLHVAGFLFSAALILACADLWTKVIDKAGYGIIWDVCLFGFIYIKTLTALVL